MRIQKTISSAAFKVQHNRETADFKLQDALLIASYNALLLNYNPIFFCEFSKYISELFYWLHTTV